MAEDTFHDRMVAATKVVRSEESALKRRIGKLYEDSAAQLSRQVEQYGADSLTGRRADALISDMKSFNRQLWQQVQGMAENAVRRGAEIGVEAQSSMFDDLLHGIGYTSAPTFQSVFGRAQTEAVASVLNGSIYSGPNAALSKRIWNNAALQSGQLEQIISSAVAQGRSAPQLAKDLEAFVNPKALMPDDWNDIYPCPFQYKADYNAKRLAVTALNHAYYQGAIMAGRDNPYAEFMHWETSSMHLIYDICDIYQEHDEGLGIGNYSLDSAPIPHPFCRCTTYVDSSKTLKEIGNEIGDWIAGGENAKLDKAFGTWKEENLWIASPGESGIMKWQDAKFQSDELMLKHYGKHLGEFGEIGSDEYVRRARSLLMDKSDEILEMVRSDQSVSRYKPSTNEFVVGTADGKIRTYFLPKKQGAYWIEEMRRNE